MHSPRSLYETWLTTAYDSQGNPDKKFWSKYTPVETRIYDELLATASDGTISLNTPLTDFAKKYELRTEVAVGFVEGISGALPEELDLKDVTEDFVIDVKVDLDKLFRKMVEFKAKHLYTLPKWNDFYSPEDQERMIDEQRRSGIVIVGDKPGRNDPCECGSGKKYKKCCGAAA